MADVSNLPGRRIADDKIYLNEDRHAQPKRIFVEMAELIAESQRPAGTRLLDIGCATGELISYLLTRFPAFKYSGLDISPAMIEVARACHPHASFHVGDAQDLNSCPAQSADVVTMSGVLNCFDDPKPVLANILAWAAPRGRIVLLDMINNEPIDVLVRYRRVGDVVGPWEAGWNNFSRAGLEDILRKETRVASWRFVPFHLPFDLPRRTDPMRTWTIATEQNEHQLVNGARQLVDLSFLIVDVA